AGALALAILALVLAIAAFVVIWREGSGGLGAALTGMAISFALLAYPAYLGLRAHRLPWIYDITTDPIDPPRYEALAQLRVRDANPSVYQGLYAAEQQRSAYPDIGPLGTNATVQAAYNAVLTVVNKRKDSFLAPYWRIMDARPPLPPRREGRIEAVVYSSLLGLRDDVVIRVRAEPEGARDRILEVGGDGASRCRNEPRIEPDINGAHDARNVRFALGQVLQDRGVAPLSMLDVVFDEARRVAHDAAVTREVDRLRAGPELFQRRHVVAHRAVGWRHH